MRLKDYSKLKGRTKEFGLSQGDVARFAHMSESTYSLKLKGQYPFRQNEMDAIIELLQIPPEHLSEFFFTNKV